ncbi:MAG: hypothetical protein AAGI54_13300 [Planctomycetota bacterium]
MILNRTLAVFASLAILSLLIAGCSESTSDGHAHDDHDHGHDHSHDHGHDHGEEVPLPAATLGDMTVELAQGHGPLKAGAEGHLVVKLPYSDDGATVVRAWISGIDHTLSSVGQGVYAPSHDDYDVTAMAPDPLPEDAMWWIEIEKPDGTKMLGSTKPITK